MPWDLRVMTRAPSAEPASGGFPAGLPMESHVQDGMAVCVCVWESC